MLDARDIFYIVVGAALFLLSLKPALSKLTWFNVPLFYVVVGLILAAAGSPVLDPRTSELSAVVVEHAAELIVIISLAGCGLAIDTPGTWKNWGVAYRLLLICMPLTIGAIYWLGSGLLGLPMAAAMLLAAALAPTDPVLAQAVQVGPPGKGENPMRVGLTAEAGLNDGLAFPFIYLAISFALLAAGQAEEGWFTSWLTIDLLYRVVAGLGVGWLVGKAISALIFSPMGDGNHGAWNSLLVVLAATLLSYGITEAVNGYGFLAVFMAARAGRNAVRGTRMEGYERFAHHGAEQLESVLLVLLLLWLGMFVGGGGLVGITWAEIGVALAIILIVRPAAGMLALLFYDRPRLDKSKVAFFGIRGMGSIFYIAFAQNHAPFAEIDTVWRIASITILISIVVHGFTANFTLEPDGEPEDEHPAMGFVKEEVAKDEA
jgi:NhaP-type Na+/H+ or K+/H+ antiporter